MEDSIISLPKLPKGFKVRNTISHTGKIFFNLAVTSSIITALCLLATIIAPFLVFAYYMLLIMAVIFTLGAILLAHDFMSWMDPDAFTKFMEIVMAISKYTIYATTILSFLAAILLLFDNKRSVARIVISFILFVISLIISIVVYLGGAQ